MLDRLIGWLRGEPEYVELDPLAREALRTGRRLWPTGDGGSLRLLSTDTELRMTPEERWTRRNEEALREGCRCGKPATVAVADYSVTGAVPFMTYSCEEHRDVASWSGSAQGAGPMVWTPNWAHPR